MNKKTLKLLKRLPKNIILSLISLICVFPLFWVIIAATNKSVDVLRGTLLPGMWLGENWKPLVTSYNITPALINSVKYSVVTTFASLVVSSIAGYGFEVYHDRGKDSLFKLLMLTMMIPFTATMIPLYRMYAKMHLLDTTLGFILPSVSAVLISTLPTIVVFFALQKSFVQGMTGAVKG